MSKNQPTSSNGLKSLLGVSDVEETSAPASDETEVEETLVDEEVKVEESLPEKQARLADLRDQARRLLQQGTEDLRKQDDLEQLQIELVEAKKRKDEAAVMLGIATEDAKAAQLRVDNLQIRIAAADKRTPEQINQEYLNRTRDERFRKAALVQEQQRALMENAQHLGLTRGQIAAVGHSARSALDQATAKKNIEARKQGLV